MNKKIFSILLLPLFMSCLSFNYNFVLEKFVEYEDVDFNNIKKINIISKNKNLSEALKYYILATYKNRGLSEPKIYILENKKDGLSNELNIDLNKFEYNIKSEFNREGDYVRYQKTIGAKYSISFSKSGLSDIVYDMTDDIDYKIQRKTVFKTLSDKEINNQFKKIDNYSLFYGLVDKIFRGFFQKRLMPISRELINFKIGLNKDLINASKLVSKGKLDEALILWEQIFSDSDNSYYARSISAFNIGMYKAIIDKDFDGAEIYFSIYDNLEEERINDFIRF